MHITQNVCSHASCQTLATRPNCIDRPIPYRVTTAGHQALEEALELDLFDQCEHRYEMLKRGLLVCQTCGYQPKITRGAAANPQMKRA